MGLSLEAPDHTTVSRRSPSLKAKLIPIASKKPIHLIIDSTGLSIVGEGEWAAAKHGGRGKRGWRKLHIGVERAGVIRAQVRTESSGDDATTGIKVIKKTSGKLASVTGDAAYDTAAIYDQASSRGARVVVPPTRTASVSGGKPRSKARDCTIRRVAKVGRKRWKKEPGYHRQGVVENAFFRYKSMLGDKLHARGLAVQGVEAAIGCKILNRQLVLGRPSSVPIAR
ncbi:MAG: IS5 family transposase [Planctomycetota bacterium]|jgi:IS5 family transposase